LKESKWQKVVKDDVVAVAELQPDITAELAHLNLPNKTICIMVIINVLTSKRISLRMYYRIIQ